MQARQLGEAEACFREVLAINPDDADALNLLGHVCHESGHSGDAVENIQKALDLDPSNVGFLNNLGLILQAVGKPGEALECYRKIVKIASDAPEAHINMGNALKDLGQTEDAIASFRQALALKPDYPEAHFNLATVQHLAGGLEDAFESYDRALALKPDFPQAVCNRGNVLKDMGRLEDAVESYRTFISRWPDFVRAEAHVNLGNTLRDLGRMDEVIDSCRQALTLDSGFAPAHISLGNAYKDLRRHEDAINSYRQALKINPDMTEAHCNLGIAFQELGRLEDAVDSYRKALDINPGFAQALYNLGNLYEKSNDLEQAEIYIQEALAADPGYIPALISQSVLLHRSGQTQDAIEGLERLLSETTGTDGNARIHFRLGHLYDYEKDSTSAFEHFLLANQASAKGAHDGFPAVRYRGLVESTRKALTAGFGSSWPEPPPEKPAQDTPVFLVGFPRSGTTLLDQILDSHPRIQVLDEKPTFDGMMTALQAMPGGYPVALGSLSEAEREKMRNQYFAAVDGYLTREADTVLVDKFPLNIHRIPLIHRLFPEAKILLSLRHPLDVVLSNLMQNYALNDAMASFLTLDDTVKLYIHVMGLWRQCEQVFPLRTRATHYESVVENLEAELRGILKFLEVEWDDRVMDYRSHARERGLINTPSYAQVTEPIYQRARYRWTRYQEQLKPCLDDLSELITAFGYSTDPDEPFPKTG